MTSAGNKSHYRQQTDAGAATQAAKTLTAALGTLLGMTTLLGFCLHLAGDVAHSTYLRGLGIQPTLLPQAVDAKIIQGYYVAILQGVAVLKDVPWRIVLVILLLATLTIVLLNAPVSKNPRLKSWLSQRSYWVSGTLSATAATTAFFSAITAVWYAVLLVAIVPGFAAERHGKMQAEQMMEHVLRRDESDAAEIWKGDERIARGHVLAASPDLIAIYDFELKRARTLPANGLEIRTPAPSATPSGERSKNTHHQDGTDF